MSAARGVHGSGLPASLYTDRGSHYFHTPKACEAVDKTRPTQVGRTLDRLGVEHIPAYSPEARGRSERMFGTLQDRLPEELALATGRYKVCWQSPTIAPRGCDRETARKVQAAIAEYGILHVPHERKAALSHNAGRTAGAFSGGSAINLAYLPGVRRIVLLG